MRLLFATTLWTVSAAGFVPPATLVARRLATGRISLDVLSFLFLYIYILLADTVCFRLGRGLRLGARVDEKNRVHRTLVFLECDLMERPPSCPALALRPSGHGHWLRRHP